MEVDDDCYRLFLPKNWIETESLDTEQRTFHSLSKNSRLTVSCAHIDFGAKSVDQIADQLLTIRHRTEMECTGDRKLFLSDPWSTAFGDALIQVNYFAYDSFDRYFFYTGFVEVSRIVSITGELTPGDQPSLESLFQEVLGNFMFKPVRDRRSE